MADGALLGTIIGGLIGFASAAGKDILTNRRESRVLGRRRKTRSIGRGRGAALA
jgi:hypothetical protein